MRIYAEKGHTLSEAERLELGRLLLKAGYIVRMGKEKQGTTNRQFVEFFQRVEFGTEKAAPGGNDTQDGSKENNSIDRITPESEDVNGLECV